MGNDASNNQGEFREGLSPFSLWEKGGDEGLVRNFISISLGR